MCSHTAVVGKPRASSRSVSHSLSLERKRPPWPRLQQLERHIGRDPTSATLPWKVASRNQTKQFCFWDGTFQPLSRWNPSVQGPQRTHERARAQLLCVWRASACVPAQCCSPWRHVCFWCHPFPMAHFWTLASFCCISCSLPPYLSHNSGNWYCPVQIFQKPNTSIKS